MNKWYLGSTDLDSNFFLIANWNFGMNGTTMVLNYIFIQQLLSDKILVEPSDITIFSFVANRNNNCVRELCWI